MTNCDLAASTKLIDEARKLNIDGIYFSSGPAAGNQFTLFMISLPDGGSSGWSPPKKSDDKITNYDLATSTKLIDDARKLNKVDGVDSSWGPAAGNQFGTSFIISLPDGGSSGWRPHKKNREKMTNYDLAASTKLIDDTQKLNIDGVDSSWAPATVNQLTSFIISLPDGGSSGWSPPKKLSETEAISCNSSSSSSAVVMSFVFFLVESSICCCITLMLLNVGEKMKNYDHATVSKKKLIDTRKLIHIDGVDSSWAPADGNEFNSCLISVPDGGSSGWRPPKKQPETSLQFAAAPPLLTS